MTKLILFEFAGREENLVAQRPHVERLLEMYPEAEFHLWDLTRRRSDQAYIAGWAASHERIVFMGQFHPGHPVRCLYPNGAQRRRGLPPCQCMTHKPPYEKPWRYYSDAIAKGWYSPDTVFVKFDDDVIWMDTERFPEMVEFLETHPDQIASANVTNNAVCAKYEPGFRESLIEEFDLGDPTDPAYDRDWWALHIDPIFAWLAHHWLTDHIDNVGQDGREPFKTREGEAISINFVAMKAPLLQHVATLMDGRYGDEGAVDTTLPWIVPNFRAAHLTFGPQERGLEHHMDQIRQRYMKHGK